jgi:DNA-binding Lrp family transcriptional regulator
VTASTNSPESVTEKDRQLIQLLIEQPMLTNAQIARKLGVSRQAVSERRKKLEREGVIQRYVYWNIVPKLGLTKHFEIVVDGAQEKDIEELTEYLINNWKVSLAWLSGQKVVSGIILTERENLFTKIIRDEFPFVKDTKLQPIQFKKFLGQRILTKRKNRQHLHEIAKKEAMKLSMKKSIEAILFSTDPQTNSIHLIALKNRRFHPYAAMTSTDKMSEKTYVHINYGTYEMMKEMIHNKRKQELIRNLKIIFARDNSKERRIKRLLRLARHI